jgi:hypothetical protein
MAGKGGYQRPKNPAQVSGPGAMSQRTDGKPSVDNPRQAARYISGQEYGEGQVINEIAQAAPLAAAPDQGTTAPGMRRPIPISEPSMYPDEPVTTGLPFGAGTGPEVLSPMQNIDGMAPEVDDVADIIKAMYIVTPSPELRRLVMQLREQGR